MKKIGIIKIIIVVTLLSCSCQNIETQFYNEQICPLAYYNIEKATDLMSEVLQLQERAQEETLDVSHLHEAINSTHILLVKARNFFNDSHHCIPANIYAIYAQHELNQIKKQLDSMLTTLEMEEYLVYMALIKTKFTEGFWYTDGRYINGDVQIFVIIDHTQVCNSLKDDTNETTKWIAENLPAVQPETIENFNKKNKKEYPLNTLFTLHDELLFLQEGVVETHFLNSNWFEFYTQYPFSQGIMELSRIGFNSEMNQALVYVGNYREITNGAGYLVFLIKQNDQWNISNEIIIWIS
jgi:hypothetical protein